MATNYISSHTGSEIDAGISRVKTGGDVDAHITRTDNPHGVTAAQSGADPAGTASSQVSAHEAAADPHPGYVLESNLGTASTADVTTSATDTTAGRLLKVGDFGVGSAAVTLLSGTDFNTMVVGGDYVITAGINGPSSGTVSLSVKPTHFGGRVKQEAYITTVSGAQEPIGFARVSSSDGTWGPWRKIYNEGNILPTGAPAQPLTNGAIIERSSNSNGEYVKFADGTMICTRTISVSALLNLPSLGGYRNSSVLVNFAAGFSSIPAISLVPVTDQASFMSYVSVATGSTNICFSSITLQPDSTRSGYLIAIGRWF